MGYQRIEKTTLTLTAARMNAAPFKGQIAAMKDKDPKVLALKFPLRMDPKLRGKIGRIGPEADLNDLLERVRSTSARKLVLAENLTYHDPKFAGVVVVDAPAWMAMELLAKRDIDDGKWIKTEEGYRLEGVSKSLRTPPVGTPFPWTWVIAGSAVSVTAIAGVVLYRRRSKKLAAGSGKR